WRLAERDQCAVFQCQLLHLHDFGSIGLAQRAAMCGKIICIDKHRTAVYLSVTGDHTISGNLLLLHTKVGTTVVHQLVQFIERTFVQQHSDTLASGHLPLGVLFLDLVHTAAQRRAFVQLFKPAVYFFSCHDQSSFIISNTINTWLALTESPSLTRISLTV